MLKPGDALPSVRALAQRLGVSPNTVGRAYADLSREGVIIAKAGGGSAVAPHERLDHPSLRRTRQERLDVLVRQTGRARASARLRRRATRRRVEG